MEEQIIKKGATRPFNEVSYLLKSFEISLEADEELVGVYTVSRTSLFKGLAAGKSATHAVHADSLESGHSLRAIVNDL